MEARLRNLKKINLFDKQMAEFSWEETPGPQWPSQSHLMRCRSAAQADLLGRTLVAAVQSKI